MNSIREFLNGTGGDVLEFIILPLFLHALEAMTDRKLLINENSTRISRIAHRRDLACLHLASVAFGVRHASTWFTR